MKTLLLGASALLISGLMLAPAAPVRADEDDWEDRWEDYQEDLEDYYEDLEERREEARERWEEWREEWRERRHDGRRFIYPRGGYYYDDRYPDSRYYRYYRGYDRPRYYSVEPYGYRYYESYPRRYYRGGYVQAGPARVYYGRHGSVHVGPIHVYW